MRAAASPDSFEPPPPVAAQAPGGRFAAAVRALGSRAAEGAVSA